MRYFLILLLLLNSTSAIAEPCFESTAALDAMEEKQITVINDDGKSIAIDVLIADNSFERASGFQHICRHIINKRSILFLYSSEIIARFHMNNVHAPLDIAFFDHNGRLIHTELMQTYTDTSKPLYGPDLPFQFALEVAENFLAEHKISPLRSYLVKP